MSLRRKCCRVVNPREIPRLRVPALRAKAKARDTPLGMTALHKRRERQRRKSGPKSLTPEGVSYITPLIPAADDGEGVGLGPGAQFC